jgi:hypothetical protein
MSIVQPNVSFCTARPGGFREDLPVEAVFGFIALCDVWPGDMFVAPGGVILELAGDAHWRIIDTTTGEVHVERAPNYIKK